MPEEELERLVWQLVMDAANVGAGTDHVMRDVLRLRTEARQLLARRELMRKAVEQSDEV